MKIFVFWKNKMFNCFFCFVVYSVLYSYESSPAIYDCFLFFNELELLKLRFEELYNYVDKFVLVESCETFKGDPKPLYFQENKTLFEKYEDKIIHICVENFSTENPWQREFFQRDQIIRGLRECKNKDIILVSDLDEIIAAETIPKIRTALFKDRHPLIVCGHRLYRFFLNMKDDTRWPGSAATTFSYLKHTTPNELRGQRLSAPWIENAGWHFTYMGGANRVMTKLNSFSHNEFDNMFNINDSLQKFTDCFCVKCHVVDIDETYPKFVLDNIDFFKEKGFVLDINSLDFSCRH